MYMPTCEMLLPWLKNTRSPSFSSALSIPLLKSACSLDVLGNSIITGLEFDETGKPILRLAAGSTVYAGVITSAVTASKTIWIIGTQLDY